MKSLVAAAIALSACAACAAAAGPSRTAVAGPAYTVPAPALIAPPPASAAEPSPISSASRVDCRIRARETRRGVELTAVVRSGAPFYGDYDLRVTKTGGGGSSDIVQGGEVRVTDGSATLSSAEIGLEGRSRYRAVLTVSDRRGAVCRDELRG